MEKRTGIQFYINIINLNDVSEAEENATSEVRHTIHALDTFFSAIEAYGNRHYHDSFVVEKITGTRLHMYVINDDIAKSFEIVSAVSQYAFQLTGFLRDEIPKYKTLIPFQIHVGACYGHFYEFEFRREKADEMTTIGYAANFAAKLQIIAPSMHICISENLFNAIDSEQKKSFTKVESSSFEKYEQKYCYRSSLSCLIQKYNFQRDLRRAGEIASRVNLQEMVFRDASQPLSYDRLSITECKKLNGIPFFADVRDFTSQFDADDSNLKEMAQKTQCILTTMYDTVEKCHGLHVQFQGDREFALFHDYQDYCCTTDAVMAGLRIIDEVKSFEVNVGVGQSFGRLFAAKIGVRGGKDNVLIGRTVNEADRNEDKIARKNQLVISSAVYQKLRTETPAMAELFQRVDSQTYYTELGYNAFITRQAQQQLQQDNKQKNYNGAWRKD